MSMSVKSVGFSTTELRILTRKVKIELIHWTPKRNVGGTDVWLHAFFTSALDKVSGQRHAPATLSQLNDIPAPNKWQAACVPELFVIHWRREIRCP
jgi:hypothetical protein